MEKLGKIKRVNDLRSVWPHEEYDFSKWLAKEENISQLSEAVGIEIVVEETEAAVGNFSVDIYAREEGTNRGIIIENQLEDTDYDHLGKIITYAAGKKAEAIIWIVKRARDEHKQAVAWLNQHTDENIGVFLIELELWCIGNSLPAPRFNVVERPNDWAKTVKKSDTLSPIKNFQLDFWLRFCDFAFANPVFADKFKRRNSFAKHWYNLSTGVRALTLEYTIHVYNKKLTVGFYIKNDKQLYKDMRAQQKEIEKLLEEKVEWSETAHDCRMFASRAIEDDLENRQWNEDFQWLVDKSLALKVLAEKMQTDIGRA
ncbi:MAG: DUF4268 domain-containing protein [Selenomonas ruminantium]|nr:DUF4268 domain-containing protein [Selenomonas ruminantium]